MTFYDWYATVNTGAVVFGSVAAELLGEGTWIAVGVHFVVALALWPVLRRKLGVPHESKHW